MSVVTTIPKEKAKTFARTGIAMLVFFARLPISSVTIRLEPASMGKAMAGST